MALSGCDSDLLQQVPRAAWFNDALSVPGFVSFPSESSSISPFVYSGFRCRNRLMVWLGQAFLSCNATTTRIAVSNVQSNQINQIKCSYFWSTMYQNYSYHFFSTVCALSKPAPGILSGRTSGMTCDAVLISAALSQPQIYSGEYNLWHIQLTSGLGGRSRQRKDAELFGYCCTNRFCTKWSQLFARPAHWSESFQASRGCSNGLRIAVNRFNRFTTPEMLRQFFHWKVRRDGKRCLQK